MDVSLTSLAFVVLVIISALCSGLNIGLMSLDTDDLERKAELDDPFATKILPLRRRAHLSLASILLTNVAAISAASLLLNTYLTGVLAGAISTIIIVILGEITPQAIFSNNALHLTARFIPLLYVMVYITYPLSRPMQFLLDRLFPNNDKKLHSRAELGLIVSDHVNHTASDLDEDEVDIIRGALQMSEKRVGSILTPISEVFWMTPDTFITKDTIEQLKRLGHSRIPIFNRKNSKCFGVLLLKDLIGVDFSDTKYRPTDFPLYPSPLIGSKTALDTMLRRFMTTKSHLIPVEKNGKIIGIITLEDLIEEIVGHEIEDETDERKKKREIKKASQRYT